MILLNVLSHYGLGKIIPGAFAINALLFGCGIVLYQSVAPLQLPKNIAITALYITGHLLFLTATSNAPPLREILPAVFAYQNYYDAVRPHQPYTPFHILWPCALVLHALIIRRLYQQNMLVWGILLGCLSWRIALFGQGTVDLEYLTLATDTRLDSVVWGVLLGRLLQQSAPSTQRILSHPITLGISILLLCATFIAKDAAFRAVLRPTLQGILLLPIAWQILNFKAFWADALCAQRLVRYATSISFAFFVWHYAAAQGMAAAILQGQDYSKTIAYSVSFVIALLLAMLTTDIVQRVEVVIKSKAKSLHSA